MTQGDPTRPGERLGRGANRRARAFAARGVKPGDFVAIGLPNSNTFFETTFAVWKLGATPTSLSWRLARGGGAAGPEISQPPVGAAGRAAWHSTTSVTAEFGPQSTADEPPKSPAA